LIYIVLKRKIPYLKNRNNSKKEQKQLIKVTTTIRQTNQYIKILESETVD